MRDIELVIDDKQTITNFEKDRKTQVNVTSPMKRDHKGVSGKPGK